MTALAFDQIRGGAGGNAAVLTAMQRSLGAAVLQTRHGARRRVLRLQIELVDALAHASLATSYERGSVAVATNDARASLR